MPFIKPFESVSMNDVALVGGKNASLGEMITTLTAKGLLVPSGFIITAEAYRHHLASNNLIKPLEALIAKLDRKDLDAFAVIGNDIRSLIKNAPLPQDLVEKITQAYSDMQKRYGTLCDVAVRSSATAEDLPEASFAGQQDTYLNIRGDKDLLVAVSNCFASLFTNRAISYRIDHNFDHMSVALSIGVQKMIRSDKACSGVMFTLDTESGFPDVVMINASYGLGENIVQGTVNPDEFYVHKPTLKLGFKPLLKKRLGSKTHKMTYMQNNASATVDIDVPVEDRARYCLTDDEILSLAHQAIIIEEHYTARKKSWCPMDIEWAKDGIDGKLYIIQARPETVHSNEQHQNVLEEFVLDKAKLKDYPVIVTGKSIGRKIATGKARVVTDARSISSVQPGEILVTEITDPDWEPIMKIAAAIVTNRGGRSSHAAIVSRELGIPAIVGTMEGTEKIKTGQIVTVDCSNGDEGNVYDGAIAFSVKKMALDSGLKSPVPLLMNLGNPDEAFGLSKLPSDGIGLARLEFIISNSIQIHPMALVHPERVTDGAVRQSIDALTHGYTDKKQFFVDKLAQEAGTIAAAFYPRPVIIRLSDFKSNEYRSLIGGAYFEPVEENPMLGFRGASRYHHERYQDAFALECHALKKIREEMGLTNVIIMIPFVRTVDEAQAVIKTMKQYGLEQGKNGLEIYMMCEIPSNVLLVDQFSKVFDGFSIGSNDLTQMTLGLDRDSELVSSLFDERNEAVRMMLSMAIQGAKRNKKKIGICGQAPSDYPEIAQFLIEQGISSLSLNPDSIVKTLLQLTKK